MALDGTSNSSFSSLPRRISTPPPSESDLFVIFYSTFNDLPDELKRYVFSFLSQPDAGTVHSVSWSWNRNASDDYVWSTLYYRKWHFRPEKDAWLRELRFSHKAIYRMRLSNEQERLLQLPELDANENEDERNSNVCISRRADTIFQFLTLHRAILQVYQRWGELFSKEAALFGTPIELSRELYTVAIQEFHSAHACAIDVRSNDDIQSQHNLTRWFVQSSDILIYWGDTLADLAGITPVSSSGKSLLDLLAKQKYATAKSLAQQLEHRPIQVPSSSSSSVHRPSIFEELKSVDITWDNFYSDDEDEKQQQNYDDDDDRMDTS
jgi:hypothetical protein